MKIAEDLRQTKAIFTTNNYLISEALTVLLLRTKSLSSSQVLWQMAYEKKNPWFKVYEVNLNMQKQAWKLFKAQKIARQLSFADCTLPVLARHLDTKTILSFDKNIKFFEKKGFKIIF